MKSLAMEIGGRRLGHGQPVFLVAEAGVNHLGRRDLALDLVRAAAATGAAAIKFQTCRVEQFLPPGNPDYDEYRRAALSPDDYRVIDAEARRLGTPWLATPFDEESADLLESAGVAAYKVASCDLTHRPLLAHLARKRKPIILSTGMANLEEVRQAVRLLRDCGAGEVAVLHCVSTYPSDPADVNLRAMETLRSELGVPVGFSDHTLGLAVALAAAALGASIIEKHFTLDRSLPGDDHRFSLEPAELKALAEGIRQIEQALGSADKRPAASELAGRTFFRRIIVAARSLPAGEILTRGDVLFLRPDPRRHPLDHVLSPWEWSAVEGRRLASPIAAGAPVLRTSLVRE